MRDKAKEINLSGEGKLKQKTNGKTIILRSNDKAESKE